MHAGFVPYAFFSVVRVWRYYRAYAVLGCLLSIALLFSLTAAFSAYHFEQTALGRLNELKLASGQYPSKESRFDDNRVQLDSFANYLMPRALNEAAVALALPVNEMVFRLDDNPAKPYLRYSVTVKVIGGYPVIRSFLTRVRSAVSGMSLDAISCARTDIHSVHLGCELTLSAFYNREPHA